MLKHHRSYFRFKLKYSSKRGSSSCCAKVLLQCLSELCLDKMLGLLPNKMEILCLLAADFVKCWLGTIVVLLEACVVGSADPRTMHFGPRHGSGIENYARRIFCSHSPICQRF